MKIDFVRFKAGDGVELQGWLSDQPGDMAVIHIHGMSGNGYENYFLDELRQTYAAAGITFFSIDTRGRGVISSFRLGKQTKLAGSCFELFEESADDIRGAIDYLRSKGKTRFILQGHSLGCTKAVHFVLHNDGAGVEKVVLLAPTDMSGWAASHPDHETLLQTAKDLVADGRGQELAGAQCWLDKTPISAQTYLTICEPGSSADIYGDRAGGPLLGRVRLPLLIVYGDQDIGVTRIDGNIDKWRARVKGFNNQNATISIIQGAPHSFTGYEEQLAQAVTEFIVR